MCLTYEDTNKGSGGPTDGPQATFLIQYSCFSVQKAWGIKFILFFADEKYFARIYSKAYTTCMIRGYGGTGLGVKGLKLHVRLQNRWYYAHGYFLSTKNAQFVA